MNENSAPIVIHAPQDVRERIEACVNACAGINPEAVPKLLAACEALIADYNECISASEFGDGPAADQLLETLKAELAKAKEGDR